MPSLKNYKGKNTSKFNKPKTGAAARAPGTPAQTTSAKRRPGRMEEEPLEATDLKVVEVEPTSGESEVHESTSEQSEKDHFDFYGSQVLRSRFPKVFANLDVVLTDWRKNGNFAELEIGHPVVDLLAAKGLRKAKDLETQVLESPATEKVAMQVFTTGLKVQELFAKIKKKDK